MKIAVTGKGGVGKTSFAATLARAFAAEGRSVLAADADPDANLGLALGFPEELVESIVPISKMRKMIEERTGADKDNTFYVLNPKVRKTLSWGQTAAPGDSGYGRGRVCMSGECDLKTDHQQSGPP